MHYNKLPFFKEKKKKKNGLMATYSLVAVKECGETIWVKLKE